MKNNIYFSIDLKSFYASVECIERGLDPLTSNLVVADIERTDKTICLAVSPSLKSLGISSRPRLYEVNTKIDRMNFRRKRALNGKDFSFSSIDINEIRENNDVKIEYIIARPQMSKYIEISSRIYEVYLKWIAKEDIHVYSIDEVFIDASKYLKTYNMTAIELIENIILDVLNTTGITATGGIGTNLYLAKVAMDILAKKAKANEEGVRIAFLDEMKYRKELWNHKPITDFWRVGKGYEKKLKKLNIHTMGDICRLSIVNEDILYDVFGINAELLIDHAWGYEPCNISDIKSYRPDNTSLSQGQVLHEPYTYHRARVVVREMADVLSIDLVCKDILTDQIVLKVEYDRENIVNKEYIGQIKIDHYGRKIPKHSRGTINLSTYTSSTKVIVEETSNLFDRIVNRDLTIRKLSITANHIKSYSQIKKLDCNKQLDMFSSEDKIQIDKKREKNLQKTLIDIKRKYGKNSILRGFNFEEGATQRDRNMQIGGHRS